MDADREQERFRELFSELKRVDEQTAPSFERNWQAALAESRHPRSRAPLMLRVAAAVALVAGGIAVVMTIGHGHRGPTVTREMPPTAPSVVSQRNVGQPIIWVADSTISDWQSPTSFLLDFSADESTTFRPTTEPYSGAVRQF